MVNSNVILEKSYAFALRIVKMSQYLQTEKPEIVISRQVLRSGTSIGANVEEANGAQSDKDFLSKITISYKEARETHYRLRLLRNSGNLETEAANNSIRRKPLHIACNTLKGNP